MKIDFLVLAGVVVITGIVGFSSCRQKNATPGPAEKAGAAMDNAAINVMETTSNAVEKSRETSAKAVEATKDAADSVVVKTGEGLEKTGKAIEKTGENLQQ